MLLENLESRRLTAAGTVGTAELVEGTLFISGTNGNDTFYLQDHGRPGSTLPARIRVYWSDRNWIAGFSSPETNSNSVVVTRDKIRRIVFEGFRGNDWYAGGGDLAPGRSVPVRASGGPGHDYLVGGRSNDTLMGNGGADDLTGFDGNDLIVGGFGNDQLGGVYGRDSLYGEEGDDMLTDIDSFNFIDAGEGDDTVELSSNATIRDTNGLRGGAGNDRLVSDVIIPNSTGIDELIPYNTPYAPPPRLR